MTKDKMLEEAGYPKVVYAPILELYWKRYVLEFDSNWMPTISYRFTGIELFGRKVGCISEIKCK
jgi:hypothetical protein